MSKKEKLSDKIGIYYILYQPVNNKMCKAYIDGDENYTFFFKDKMLELMNTLGVNYQLNNELEKSFCTYSFYLWDIDNASIRYMSLRNFSNDYSVIQDIFKKRTK